MKKQFKIFIGIVISAIIIGGLSLHLLFNGYVEGWYLFTLAFTMGFCSVPILILLDMKMTKEIKENQK